MHSGLTTVVVVVVVVGDELWSFFWQEKLSVVEKLWQLGDTLEKHVCSLY